MVKRFASSLAPRADHGATETGQDIGAGLGATGPRQPRRARGRDQRAARPHRRQPHGPCPVRHAVRGREAEPRPVHLPRSARPGLLRRPASCPQHDRRDAEARGRTRPARLRPHRTRRGAVHAQPAVFARTGPSTRSTNTAPDRRSTATPKSAKSTSPSTCSNSPANLACPSVPTASTQALPPLTSSRSSPLGRRPKDSRTGIAPEPPAVRNRQSDSADHCTKVVIGLPVHGIGASSECVAPDRSSNGSWPWPGQRSRWTAASWPSSCWSRQWALPAFRAL